MSGTPEKDAYATLAEKHGYAKSLRYRNLLEFLMTPDQARIAAALPGNPEELAPRLGMDVSKLKKELDRLFREGVVFPKNMQTLENFRFARDVVQLHDATLAQIGFDPVRNQKLSRLWEDFYKEEWYKDMEAAWRKLERPLLRTMTALKAIPDKSKILPCDDAREVVKAADLIAVVPCSCRVQKEGVGKKCGKAHSDVCLQFGRGAEYAISRGSGVKLTLKEALKVLDDAEEDGLVHFWYNTTSTTGATMCSCCACCCELLEPILDYSIPPTRMMARSRYEARVDQDLCTGCEDCLERCQFNAIEMVQIKGSKKSKASVDPEKCMGCGVCVLRCPADALSMELVRPPEHIPQKA